MTCSQSSCVPKARTPRICVTVLASQPSVNMDTGDHAADVASQLARLADRVQHFAEQFLIGNLAAARVSPVRSMHLAAESLDLRLRHRAEVVVQRVARFKLRAVDQERVGPAERIARDFVEVAEQGEAAVFQGRRSVFVLAVKAGNVFVNQFRYGRVLANDDEAGRHGETAVSPKLERLFVVTVEDLQGGLQLRPADLAGRAPPCGDPAGASFRECYPTGCGTSAYRCRECFRRPARVAA